MTAIICNNEVELIYLTKEFSVHGKSSVLDYLTMAKFVGVWSNVEIAGTILLTHQEEE